MPEIVHIERRSDILDTFICPSCSGTFESFEYGNQNCPHCDVPIFLEIEIFALSKASMERLVDDDGEYIDQPQSATP